MHRLRCTGFISDLKPAKPVPFKHLSFSSLTTQSYFITLQEPLVISRLVSDPHSTNSTLYLFANWITHETKTISVHILGLWRFRTGFNFSLFGLGFRWFGLFWDWMTLFPLLISPFLSHLSTAITFLLEGLFQGFNSQDSASSIFRIYPTNPYSGTYSMPPGCALYSWTCPRSTDTILCSPATILFSWPKRQVPALELQPDFFLCFISRCWRKHGNLEIRGGR